MTRQLLRFAMTILVLAGLLIVVDASPAAACSCAGTQADVAALADAVFTGSVVEAATTHRRLMQFHEAGAVLRQHMRGNPIKLAGSGGDIAES